VKRQKISVLVSAVLPAQVAVKRCIFLIALLLVGCKPIAGLETSPGVLGKYYPPIGVNEKGSGEPYIPPSFGNEDIHIPERLPITNMEEAVSVLIGPSMPSCATTCEDCGKWRAVDYWKVKGPGKDSWLYFGCLTCWDDPIHQYCLAVTYLNKRGKRILLTKELTTEVGAEHRVYPLVSRFEHLPLIFVDSSWSRNNAHPHWFEIYRVNEALTEATLVWTIDGGGGGGDHWRETYNRIDFSGLIDGKDNRLVVYQTNMGQGHPEGRPQEDVTFYSKERIYYDWNAESHQFIQGEKIKQAGGTCNP
jgi:hypothetical protein